MFDEIRKLGAIPGLSLNPPTPIEQVLPFAADCDLILTMSVMPGFGGQAFDPVALDKIRYLRSVCRDDQFLSVDGGVGEKTISDCAAAGANLFVTGTALLGQPDYGLTMKQLRTLATAAVPPPRTPNTEHPTPNSEFCS
jgi:ribulose-phosphate 3-epimerase